MLSAVSWTSLREGVEQTQTKGSAMFREMSKIDADFFSVPSSVFVSFFSVPSSVFLSFCSIPSSVCFVSCFPTVFSSVSSIRSSVFCSLLFLSSASVFSLSFSALFSLLFCTNSSSSPSSSSSSPSSHSSSSSSPSSHSSQFLLSLQAAASPRIHWSWNLQRKAWSLCATLSTEDVFRDAGMHIRVFNVAANDLEKLSGKKEEERKG